MSGHGLTFRRNRGKWERAPSLLLPRLLTWLGLLSAAGCGSLVAPSEADVRPAEEVYVQPVRPPTPDAEGRYTVELDLPGQPVHVPAGTQHTATYLWPLPPGYRLTRSWIFLGFDRLDVGEGHGLLLADDFYLALTSPHLTGAAVWYDAWHSEPANYVVRAGGAMLNFHVLCHPTVPGKSLNCEAGVVIELEPAQ